MSGVIPSRNGTCRSHGLVRFARSVSGKARLLTSTCGESGLRDELSNSACSTSVRRLPSQTSRSTQNDTRKIDRSLKSTEIPRSILGLCHRDAKHTFHASLQKSPPCHKGNMDTRRKSLTFYVASRGLKATSVSDTSTFCGRGYDHWEKRLKFSP